MFQHRVSAFSLADPTKPGHRKILVFFLCDPTAAGDHVWPRFETNFDPQVISTSSVHPQQPYHEAERIAALLSTFGTAVPEEVFQMVLSHLPPAISKSEAREYVAGLMRERAGFNN